MVRKVIVPTVTWWWLPEEKKLREVWWSGKIKIHRAEDKTEEILIDGARNFFHTATAALLDTFSTNIHGVLIAGTTGEGVVLGLEQFRVVVNSNMRQMKDHLTPYIGILWGDDMVAKQIEEAQKLWARHFVLGLNHIGDNRKRFAAAMAALDSQSSIWLYNMPTFTPADRKFVRECMKNPQVKWIKDSSGNIIDFRALLELKEERPDFEIYIGSEPIAAELTEDELAITEGIIAGNGNIDPELLTKYTQKPRENNPERQSLHAFVHGYGRVDNDAGAGGIRNHIHGIKFRASEIIEGVDNRHVIMYSERGGLFRPYSE